MSHGIWVGTRKGLFQLTEQDGGWRVASTHFLGAKVPMVLPCNDGSILAALDHGHFGSKVHRSNDHGKSWTEVATPSYPPKPDNVPDTIDPMRKTVIPWTLEMIWALEQAPDGRIWCGTLPGGLFYSDDKANSWHLNWPLWNLPNRSKWFGGGYDIPGIHSICIHPTNPRQLAVAISCGGVWKSSNGGESWEIGSMGMRAEFMPPDLAGDPDIQDPHRMVQCPSQPDHYWVQHHNGIFQCSNNLSIWNEIHSDVHSTFGFAVCVHPKDPQTAWFVPAVKDSDRYPAEGKFIVARTRDGGQSFECLSHGLPQNHAYHLVYRHGLDIDVSGDRLIMGSTTGGLWFTGNGGDSWTTLSQDLPPIFCVRFA